jgi:hypothetical protein
MPKRSGTLFTELLRKGKSKGLAEGCMLGFKKQEHKMHEQIEENNNNENKKSDDLDIDVSEMKPDALLKFYEIEWQDHYQTRKKTWLALQMAGILTVAIVGLQWSTENPIVIICSSFLLWGVSLFGMQITRRHRNSTEYTKFRILKILEKELNFKSKKSLKLPEPISYRDIFRIRKISNTSIFLMRMQAIIHALGWVLLGYGAYRLIASLGSGS